MTGWEARRYLLRDGARVAGLCQVLLRRLPLGVSVAYAARGPLVWPGDLPAALVALRSALLGERGACLLADPELAEDGRLRATLGDAGVRRSPVHVQPRRTLLVDLGREPADLLAAMRKKTRQYVHKAEREGVLTEETADLGRFLAVLDRVATRDRFALHDPAYFARLREVFGDRAHLFVARVGGEDAGALLLVRFAGRAWELFGGWSGTQTEHRPFYLLKWRALLRMRALGVRRYDMWGLDEDGSLAGVEAFKRGFGGDEATWLGMLETPVVRLLWPVWRLAGRRRLARSVAA